MTIAAFIEMTAVEVKLDDSDTILYDNKKLYIMINMTLITNYNANVCHSCQASTGTTSVRARPLTYQKSAAPQTRPTLTWTTTVSRTR